MDYRLELLDDSEFEKLVNTICQKVLGTGVVSFSPGKDGGKDGRYTGIAQNYPSTASPWSGKFIIQSKHTEVANASCSDYDFKKIVEEEIEKISKLKKNGEVENYLLFTNRKFSGVTGDNLVKKIRSSTGLDNVEIIGKSDINDLYLNPNKDIVRLYGLDKLHIPFSFSEREIKEVLLAFKNEIKSSGKDIQAKSEDLKYDYSHISKSKKNKKNKLSEEYFQQHVLGTSLQYFDTIESFLTDPRNDALKDYYYDTAAELNELITLKRDSFDAFEELFLFIYQTICDGSQKLMGHKRYVRVFLHYMYVECLIGEK